MKALDFFVRVSEMKKLLGRPISIWEYNKKDNVVPLFD
jgi:hypothetical protein